MTYSHKAKSVDCVTIGTTTKGRRVWLQTLEAAGWPAGTQYRVDWTANTLTFTKDTESKRKVTAGKGGIIDVVSKKVTVWAQGAPTATVFYCGDTIIVRPNHEES